MATISRHGKGWRAQIRRRGFPRLSETFPLRKQAEAWAAQRESEIIQGRLGVLPRHTLLEALQKFAAEVSPKHKGVRWERVRLAKLGRSTIASKQISSITATDLANWRDEALLTISGASVRREMGLLGQVFDLARREWKWVNADPMKDVDRPPERRPRPKGVPQEWIDKVVAELGDKPSKRQVAIGFLLGIETAMRPWEMLGLEPEQVDFEASVAHLDETKNGDDRDVPLSTRARELLLEMLWITGGKFFTVSADTVTQSFGAARKRAGIDRLHFRHSRGEGISRLSKVLDILELARAVGHRDLKSLMIYYHSSAADMAKKLP